jgi:hypothetical protein
MDINRLLGGLIAAAFVLLWGVPSLVSVLLSEPPPTRVRKLKAIINAMASIMLGYLSYLLAVGWAAGFLNSLVEKFLGVNPHVDQTVAGVVVAVLVTGVGPAALERLEKILGRKIDEVAQ